MSKLLVALSLLPVKGYSYRAFEGLQQTTVALKINLVLAQQHGLNFAAQHYTSSMTLEVITLPHSGSVTVCTWRASLGMKGDSMFVFFPYKITSEHSDGHKNINSKERGSLGYFVVKVIQRHENKDKVGWI